VGSGTWPNARQATILFDGRGLRPCPIDDTWQAWRMSQPEMSLGLVLSAVDKNSARHAIQDALPRLILGASTIGMRAQLNLYDVLQGGLCLRCRNPLESPVSDDVIIERLRGLAPTERDAEPLRVGGDPSVLQTFHADPGALRNGRRRDLAQVCRRAR
jgi:hypothetical protein